jgi:WD40 repeat protein
VFSPDGERVAVAYDDSTAVNLLSGKDLGFLHAADISGVDGANILVVGWSADGRYLFAGGEGNGNKIRRWENADSGRHIDLKAAHNTVMGLLPLKNGGVLFAAQDPAFGIIDAQGGTITLQVRASSTSAGWEA